MPDIFPARFANLKLIRKRGVWVFILYLVIYLITLIGFIKANFSTFQAEPKHFLSQLVPVSAIVAVLIFVPILILLKAVSAFFSKQLFWGWKLTIGGLLALVCLQAVGIFYTTKYPVSLGSYNFYDQVETLGADYDNYVQIKGTWISDTKLSAPLQTTELDCWRDNVHCIEMTAYVGFAGGNHLSVAPTYWDIEYWGPDEIRVKDNETALCTTYRLRIDRKNKTVTNIRTTKQPKPKGCDGIQDEPIVMHLGDGYKLQK